MDLEDENMVVTYTNLRCHGEVYASKGTMMVVTGVNSDGDALLEDDEKYKMVINFTELTIDGVDLAASAGSRSNLYAHPYKEFRIELKLSQGAVLAIEKLVPAV